MPRCSRGTVTLLVCIIVACNLLFLTHLVKRKMAEMQKTQRFVDYSNELEVLTKLLEDLEKNSRNLEEDIIFMHETAFNKMDPAGEISPLEKPQETNS